MSEDLILSVVKDRKWSDIDCYAISTSRCGFRGRKVMLVENVEQLAIDELRLLGFEVISLKTTMSGLHFQSSRFFIAANYLGEHRGKFKNVIWTDAGDVVFQTDPALALERILGSFQLVAVKEGWAIKNQAINDVWIKRLGLSPAEYESLREEEVLCSGTIAGRSEAMLFLFVQIGAVLQRRPDEMQGIDQGIFNRLIRTAPFNSITRIPEPEEGFATTLGIFLAPSDYGVWTIAPPRLDRASGVAFTPNGVTPYAIMHQYNRNYGLLDPVGDWRGIVERRYRS